MRKLIASLLCVCVLGSGLAVAKDEIFEVEKNPLSWGSKNTTATISGLVMVMGRADFGGAVSNNNFWTALIPTNENYANQSSLGFDVEGTRLGLGVKHKTKIGDIEGLFEFDFASPATYIRIRHAYVRFNGLTIGQTWSLMCDLAANPMTVDRIGTQSRTFMRCPMIAYQHKFKSGLSLGAAAELPNLAINMDMAGVNTVAVTNRRLPDVPLYLQYGKGDNHIKVSGVFRGLTYNNVAAGKIQNVLGWGAQLSGSVKVAPRLTLYGQGIYGEGIANYINSTQILNLNLMPNITNNGEAAAIPMYGASAGLQLKIVKGLVATAAYSYTGVSEVEDYHWDNTYRYSDFASVSMFWEPVKPLLFGLEYLHGNREDMDGDKGKANRICLTAIYKF